MTRIADDDPRRNGNQRRRRSFSHKDKMVTVVASEVVGIRETAKHLRVNQETIKRWRNAEDLRPYVEEVRIQIMGNVSDVANRAWALTLQRLQNAPDDISDRDLLAIAAEATTKMQLIGGGATARTETRDVTEGFDAEEVRYAVSQARQYLAQHGPRARSALVGDTAVGASAKTVSDPA